jgi:hypothetical protein
MDRERAVEAFSSVMYSFHLPRQGLQTILNGNEELCSAPGHIESVVDTLEKIQEQYEMIEDYNGVVSMGSDVNAEFIKLKKDIKEYLDRYSVIYNTLSSFDNAFFATLCEAYLNEAGGGYYGAISSDISPPHPGYLLIGNYKPNETATSLLNSSNDAVGRIATQFNNYILAMARIANQIIENSCLSTTETVICNNLHSNYIETLETASAATSSLIRQIAITQDDSASELTGSTSNLQSSISDFITRLTE